MSGESFDPSKAGATPHIYLTPRPYSSSWYGPDAHKGTLQVDVYFWLPGNNQGVYNAIDALDLWEIVEHVFYPLGGTAEERTEKQYAIRRMLIEAGGTSGQITFSQPATQQQTGENGLVSYGSLQLEITRRISP